ncbi:MAG TPA: BrnT family toxin [Thermomicrobiales bacterium]|nr:BrnT family toxin [Thermomicrobiales bacterium]
MGEARAEFEWDEDKRRSNIAKHGIDFVRARAVFDGRPLAHIPSPVPHEARTMTIAILDDVHVAAVWTERDGKRRFIAVRRASRSERTLYQALTQP